MSGPRTIQTPPDVKIALGADLIKMVGLGVEKGAFRPDTEYWRTGTLSGTSFSTDTLAMTYDSIKTEQDIRDHFRNATEAFETSRTSAMWLAGARKTPEGRAAFLFSMSDPDDTTRRIGLLIETTTAGETTTLNAVVFYKTKSLADRQIWGDESTPSTMWNRVTGADGRTPSTDPTDIDREYTEGWSHTVME